MNITKERLEEIKAFKTTDFSDSPILTEEQMKEFKPSHLRKVSSDACQPEQTHAGEVEAINKAIEAAQV